MRRVVFVVLAVVLLVSTVLAASALTIGGTDRLPAPTAQVNEPTPTNETASNETATNGTALPTNVSAPNSSGARLAAAVAVEGIELRNEQQNRTLEVELERTNDTASRAAVIAATRDDIRDRLDTLEARRDRLVAAWRAGSIDEDRYHAESAAIAAQGEGLEDRVERLDDAVKALPGSQLDEDDITETDLERLEERAEALADGERIDDADDRDDNDDAGDEREDDGTGDDDGTDDRADDNGDDDSDDDDRDGGGDGADGTDDSGGKDNSDDGDDDRDDSNEAVGDEDADTDVDSDDDDETSGESGENPKGEEPSR